jgi:hypothetical protein
VQKALASAAQRLLDSANPTFSETEVETHRWRILGVALGAGAFETVLSHYP